MQNERVAVITGASSWLGDDTARRLAERGLSLVLASPRATRIDRLSGECRELGVEVVTVRADVSRDEDAALIASRAIDAFGGFDVWINNPCVGAGGPLERARTLDDETIVRTNLVGTLHGSHHALIHFRRRRQGVLINLAFAPGRTPSSADAACTATRFGIVGLGSALRDDLRAHGLDDVRVCTVLPSAMGPLARLFPRENGANRPLAVRPAVRNGAADRTADTAAEAGASTLVDLIAHLVDQPRDEAVAEQSPWRKVDAAVETPHAGTTHAGTTHAGTTHGQRHRARASAEHGAHLDATPLRAFMSLPSEHARYGRSIVPHEEVNDESPSLGTASESKTPGRLAGAGAHRDDHDARGPKGRP